MVTKKIIKVLTILIIFNFSLLSVKAQDYSYVQYTTREGLPGTNIYHTVQDRDGFIWLASENGLSRFDGKTFVNFTTDDGLPDNEILRLFVDSKNRIWAIPYRQSICYYQRGKIYTTENDSLLGKLSLSGEVLCITENAAGELKVYSFKKGKLFMQDKHYYVYILTRARNSVFYVGVTNNLVRRVHEHKMELVEGFTKNIILKSWCTMNNMRIFSLLYSEKNRLKNGKDNIR